MQPLSQTGNTVRGPLALTSTWPDDVVGRADVALRGWLLRTGTTLIGFARDFTRDDGGRAYEEVRGAAGDWMQRSNWPVRPLQIGLVNPGDWSAQLFDAAPMCDTEWYSLPRDFSQSRDGMGLDATVSPLASGGISVQMPEYPKKDAAWYDWAMDRPLSFPAVFPTRTDCACLTLQTWTNADALLARRLIEAAAVSSRHPARLTFADLTIGRMPASERLQRKAVSTPRPYLPNHDAVSAMLRSLAITLRDQGRTPGRNSPVSPARRAAARVAGAWLATTPGGVDDETRRECMEAVATLIGEEPATMLRLAAVRLGTLEDDLGLDAILRADRMLRDNDMLGVEGHAAFLAAEFQHGASTPMTVGRLAAGLCMAGAALPIAKVGHFFGDLMDDMRFADLLVGRDHDRALLTEVCRAIEKGRRVESFSLPAAAEAKKTVRRRKAA